MTEKEFEEEGREMWEKLKSDEYAKNVNETFEAAMWAGSSPKPKAKATPKQLPPAPLINEVQRLEIKRMIVNSQRVVRTCQAEQEKWIKKEQYFKANEVRVAGICHQSFIDRLSRILRGEPAFDFNIQLSEETISIS